MARIKKSSGDNGTPIGVHQHSDSARLNIPDATQAKTDVPKAKKPVYRYSPHLSPKLRLDLTGSRDQAKAVVAKVAAGQKLTPDEIEVLKAIAEQGAQPWLEWANKQELEGRGSFQVDDVVLHVHERVSAKAIIAAAQKDEQVAQDLFARPKLQREQALQYYRHNIDWANRLILGDSLQVMSSLANRENLAGKVQMIYFDPPYGIKFSSNWQNELDKRDIKDKDEDLSREPEMIKAYRDTWKLGVHSYLTYIKQRLIVARDLLKDGSDGSGAGSIFVQISDENIHRVRAVLDEVFTPENFVAQIQFKKTGGFETEGIPGICDYLLWYSKDKAVMKFNRLYDAKVHGEGSGERYNSVYLADGSTVPASQFETKDGIVLPKSAKLFLGSPLTSDGASTKTVTFEFQGRELNHKPNQHWKTTPDGLLRLAAADRLIGTKEFINYRLFLEDFAATPLNNMWTDTMGTAERDKVYVVQTTTKIIERCMLMTTDPGDMVLDPTCGSGTTAYAAEQWGRRWITIDTSRVALALARQRLLTASFESYKTKDPTAGADPTAPQNPGFGFFYDTIPHITLRSVAQNSNLDPIFLKYKTILEGKHAILNSLLKKVQNSVKTHLVEKLI